MRDPREQKASDTRGTRRARDQTVTTQVPTVVETFFTVLTVERRLLGVGPLVSMQHRVVGELIGAEITAVGLLAHVGLLVNTQIWVKGKSQGLLFYLVLHYNSKARFPPQPLKCSILGCQKPIWNFLTGSTASQEI